MNIRARAPLRISFAGGGTDVPPFPEREGGVVLNATIDRYAYGMLRPRRDRRIRIESADFGVALSYGVDETPMFDGKLDLVKAAIRKLGDASAPGFDLFLHSNAPPGSGLGSSSTRDGDADRAAQGVPRPGAHRLRDRRSCRTSIERIDLGMLGGMQDQYAATFGGFNYIEFGGDRVIVNPLRMARRRGPRARAQHAALLHRRDPPLGRHHRGPDAPPGGGRASTLAALRSRSSWRWR